MIRKSTPDAAAPGRGLDSTRDAAILDAALQLVSEVGYDRVTMDAIANRAHSSKATMYRRWDSKASLVVDALKLRHHAPMALPDTGDVRNDLLAGLSMMCSSFETEDLSLMTGLITATRNDPELARLLKQQMFESKTELGREWTDRAVSRGLLPPGVDLGLFHEVAPAIVLMRMVVTGEQVDEEFITSIVDTVLMPIFNSHANA